MDQEEGEERFGLVVDGSKLYRSELLECLVYSQGEFASSDPLTNMVSLSPTNQPSSQPGHQVRTLHNNDRPAWSESEQSDASLGCGWDD